MTNWIAVGAFVMCVIVWPAVAEVPTDVQNAINAAFPAYLSQDFDQAATFYGFKSSDRLEDVSLGTPFRFYFVSGQDLLDAGDGATVASLLPETCRWLVPLLVEGQFRALMEMNFREGEWKAVAVGMAGLAAAWRRVTDQWSEDDGYSPVLIETMNRLYFSVPGLPEDNLTRLIPFSTEGEPGLAKAMPEPVATTPAVSAIADLKHAVDNFIEQQGGGQ